MYTAKHKVEVDTLEDKLNVFLQQKSAAKGQQYKSVNILSNF
jgi:hypothetical protein